MTRIRSARPISSGISDEIIRIATPSRASPRMRSWMPALAPTSTPRVGSSKISTPGWVASHFASTTFCWLPPERKRASCSSERARSSTERARSWTETVFASRRRCRPPIARSASSVLSRIGCASARPSSLRSSVMKPMPAPIPARGPRPRLLAVDLDGAGLHRVGAEQRARQLGAAGALQAGEADDLAGADLDVDVVQHRRRDAGRLQPDVAELLGRAAGREVAVELAADHERDELAGVDLRGRLRRDVLAVLQHRDAVADGEDLAQAVGDVDHPEPALAQPAQQVEQHLDLVLGQRGGRLVEHEQARVERERLDDLDDLLLRGREPAHERVGPERDLADLLEQLGGAPLHRLDVDDAVARRLAVDEDVLGDRAVGQEVELLEDDRDAGRLRLDRVGEVLRLAVDQRPRRRRARARRPGPSSASTCRRRSRPRPRGSRRRCSRARPRGAPRRRGSSCGCRASRAAAPSDLHPATGVVRGQHRVDQARAARAVGERRAGPRDPRPRSPRSCRRRTGRSSPGSPAGGRPGRPRGARPRGRASPGRATPSRCPRGGRARASRGAPARSGRWRRRRRSRRAGGSCGPARPG